MKKSHVLVIFWLGLGNPCHIATKSPFCMVVVLVLVWKSWYLILLWARFTNELQLNTAINWDVKQLRTLGSENHQLHLEPALGTLSKQKPIGKRWEFSHMGEPLHPSPQYGNISEVGVIWPKFLQFSHLFHFESVPYGIVFNLFQYPLPSHHLIKLNQICAISIYINPTKLHPTCY